MRPVRTSKQAIATEYNWKRRQLLGALTVLYQQLGHIDSFYAESPQSVVYYAAVLNRLSAYLKIEMEVCREADYAMLEQAKAVELSE